MLGFKIRWETPWAPSAQNRDLLDTMSFRVGLETTRTTGTLAMTKPEDFKVDLWTNLYHKNHNEGDWHSVPMQYQGTKQVLNDTWVMYMYGVDLILTCLGTYNFDFKARCKYTAVQKWGEDFKFDGIVTVRQPVKDYTTWIQEPEQAQITHNIYIGNHNAALQAPEQGFDCLLNMADDAPVFAQKFIDPIIFKKCPIPAGANNPISDEVLHNMVLWLRAMSDRCRKILISSRSGHGRAGSIMLAFIYYMNPNLTFDEAYAFVNKRFFIYNHKGLKRSLRSLYPRD